MNSIHFSTPDYSTTGLDEVFSENQIIRPNRISPINPFLMRLAVKVSRARWYSFLRRVYHYQNGSGSDLGPNPFNSRNWILMELVALLVQVSGSCYTLMVSKVEKPGWPMRIWVSGYVVGCLFSLVMLCWRYWAFVANRADDNSSVSDVEQQTTYEESGSLQCMYKCRRSLELLFAIWFVVGNVWISDSRFGSYSAAPKLYILCISLLAWNVVAYSFPFLLFVFLCCCVPLLSKLVGYNINDASLRRGTTNEQLAALPSWRYKDAGCNLEIGDSAKDTEIQGCCICLAKYKDKEEIRQLPCTHVFHLKCVDHWLKIVSCCPLCKQGIEI